MEFQYKSSKSHIFCEYGENTKKAERISDDGIGFGKITNILKRMYLGYCNNIH